MIAFIDDHRTLYGVEPVCRVLPIAPSTYRAHVARRVDPGKASARTRRDAVPRAQIRQVFEANFGVYGVRKVCREGSTPAHCTIARLMRQMGLRGVVRGKEVRTTIPGKAPCPADRVNRQFHAAGPNLLWLADFTYVATWQGFVYVAFVIDAFARLASSAGGYRGQRMLASSSMPWSRHCMTADPSKAPAWCTIATGGRSTSPFAIRNVLLKRELTPQLAALATVTTMLWLKPSTACSRLRSSAGAGPGDRWKP